MKRTLMTFNRASGQCNGRVAALAARVFVDNRTGMSRRSAVRAWLALALASVSAFLSMWILVPAPSRALLPLGVGAPEVSAWLALLGLVALVLALRDVRRRWSARFASLLAAAAMVTSALPFLRFRETATAADHALRMALGGKYLASIPDETRVRLRPATLVPIDLFRGMRAPTRPPRTTRDIPVSIVGGDTLTMDVYRPVSDGPYPVLVQVYGGAWQRGDPGDFAPFAERMADLGYLVMAIDYRHAPAHRFPAQLDDVRHALAWVGANANIWSADTSRLALIGRSAGAHLAMLAAYAPDAPRIRGVVDYYGPVDLIEGYRNPPSPDPLDVRAIEEAFIGGTPDSLPDQYRAASPISLVTRHVPPTLLIYGGRDHIVEPRFGTLLAGRLRAEGNVVVHVEIPWAEHAFDNVPNGPSGQLAQYVTERFLASVMNAR